ncbi:MAG: hypothetical protein J6034_00460 [Bacteroidaceae bacterium]|nr:hypothetical protein [Bacteroidaceae bacterium]
MKAVKFLSMFAVALVMSLSFSSCKDDDDKDSISTSISELTDTGSAFTYSYTSKVMLLSVSYEITYGYEVVDGVKKITSHKEVTTWPDAEMAQEDYNASVDDPMCDVTLSGNKVICDYKSSEYEGMTEDDVRDQYELQKSIIEAFNM